MFNPAQLDRDIARLISRNPKSGPWVQFVKLVRVPLPIHLRISSSFPSPCLRPPKWWAWTGGGEPGRGLGWSVPRGEVEDPNSHAVEYFGTQLRFNFHDHGEWLGALAVDLERPRRDRYGSTIDCRSSEGVVLSGDSRLIAVFDPKGREFIPLEYAPEVEAILSGWDRAKLRRAPGYLRGIVAGTTLTEVDWEKSIPNWDRRLVLTCRTEEFDGIVERLSRC